MRHSLPLLWLAALCLSPFAPADTPARAGWKAVAEITLTLPKGTSKASGGNAVRVTFLRDGTAIKRDFTGSVVYNGSLPKGAFEKLAKAVESARAFEYKRDTAADAGPLKTLVVVKGNERRRLEVPVKSPDTLSSLFEKLESQLDQVQWSKL